MPELTPVHGEIQKELMATLWKLGAGTVEDVRAALPGRYRGAYTTVQTLLNRLAERGLLSRERDGRAIVYRARITEAEYLSQSIRQVLVAASPSARGAALALLLEDLAPDELSELQRLGTIAAKRNATR